MSVNPVPVFQEAIRQLRAMDETDSDPSRSPIPFNDSFVESFENACKEHGLSFPLLYEQLGEPALDGGPRCILRVMDPTSDGRQLYQLRWRVGWNNWASLEDRRLFRVWLREAFERAIGQVKINGMWQRDVDLAATLCVHPLNLKSFRYKLRRMRVSGQLSTDDWKEVANHKRTAPRFLYNTNAETIVAMSTQYSRPRLPRRGYDDING